MKCPKCGYNSFECFTTCKKCSQNLTEFKDKLGLRPIVLQTETRSAMVAAMAAEAALGETAQQPVEQPSDMFSFDIPDDKTPAATSKTTAADDFFNFTDQPAATPSGGFGDFSFEDGQEIKKPATMDDAFASLLESTPHGLASPPAAPPASSSSEPGSSLDEFDLDSFSWDETPGTPAGADKKPVDDFDSLFGEISDSTKK
jgi:hypothetical protein